MTVQELIEVLLMMPAHLPVHIYDGHYGDYLNHIREVEHFPASEVREPYHDFVGIL